MSPVSVFHLLWMFSSFEMVLLTSWKNPCSFMMDQDSKLLIKMELHCNESYQMLIKELVKSLISLQKT